ncbi:GL22496 [Drosophila persimilis]|uniref:GL22496 n=1 Tax=Drosophila persimilis TaxID=7234 RepID=B4H1E2_DROPE|nr:GL22496 [Drosophila persimilis]
MRASHQLRASDFVDYAAVVGVGVRGGVGLGLGLELGEGSYYSSDLTAFVVEQEQRQQQREAEAAAEAAAAAAAAEAAATIKRKRQTGPRIEGRTRSGQVVKSWKRGTSEIVAIKDPEEPSVVRPARGRSRSPFCRV